MPGSDLFLQTIDAVYASGLDAARVPHALEATSRLLGASGAGLEVIDKPLNDPSSSFQSACQTSRVFRISSNSPRSIHAFHSRCANAPGPSSGTIRSWASLQWPVIRSTRNFCRIWVYATSWRRLSKTRLRNWLRSTYRERASEDMSTSVRSRSCAAMSSLSARVRHGTASQNLHRTR